MTSEDSKIRHINLRIKELEEKRSKIERLSEEIDLLVWQIGSETPLSFVGIANDMKKLIKLINDNLKLQQERRMHSVQIKGHLTERNAVHPNSTNEVNK